MVVVVVTGMATDPSHVFSEADSLVATAQYDFNARSNRELSIRKGDAVLLRKQVSTDWWMGSLNGKEGLVPDKYISLRIK